MTTKVTNIYNLKLTPSQFGQNSLVVNCSQYDSLYRVIQFNLFNGNAVYSIPEGSVVTIRGTKKDLTGFEYECDYSNNVVTFPLQQQITIFPGKVPAELRITNNGEIIGSWNFLFLVEESPLSDETTISETQLPLLEQAIEAADRLNEAFDDITQFTDETYPNAVQAIQSEGATQVANVTNEGTTQKGLVESEGSTQIANVQAEGTTQKGLVTSEGTTQVANVQAKGTEVLDSIPDDYTELSEEVDDINKILFTKSAYTFASIADKTLNTSGWTSTLAGYSVTSALPTDAFDYVMPEYTLTMTGSQRAVMFFTTSSLGTGVVDSSISVASGEKIPIPDGAHYVRFTFPTNTPPTINSVKANRLISSSKTVGTEFIFNDSEGEEVTSVNVLDTDIFYITNYVDRATDNEGKYLSLANGTLSNNADYFTTDFIKVNPGDVLYSLYQMRFVAGYGNNAENTFVSTSTATNVYTYTVPTDVNYIRVTGYTSSIDKYIITKGFAPAEYDEPSTKIKPEYYEKAERYNTVGGGRMSATAETLASGTQITLDNFPKNLKKGVAISFCANFESFTSITIGKGYQSYRGDWFEIDATNIKWVHYEDSETVESTTAHGLTISDFLMISIDVDSKNEAVCHISLSTLGGSASFNSNWVHEQNGLPFAFGGQAMTDVCLSAIASDIRCPMWLFGDSYFGIYANRVLGQLIDIGYAENVLLDAIAGQTPENALLELQKLMSLGGVPKFIVWTLGMNGTATAYSTALATLEAIADKYDITLILYTVPTVPTRKTENNVVNTAVIGSGRRYIDAFKAVGDDTDGNWIDGYLSSDGVHPTSLGARSIAMRILVDAPEIMQYGYAPMDVDGNAVGDL